MFHNKNFVAPLCALLLVSLLIACSPQYQEVGSANDTSVPAGIYLINQLYAYSSVSSTITEKPAYKQEVDGTPASELMNEKTTELLKRYYYIEKEFSDKKLLLTPENLAVVENEVAQAWDNSEKTYMDNGVSKETLKKIITNRAKENAIFNSIYGVLGSSEVTLAEYAKYYDENYFNIEYISLPKSAADGNTAPEDKLNELQQKAKSIVSKLNEQDAILQAVAKAELPSAYKIVGNDTADFTDITAFIQNTTITESTNYYLTADNINTLKSTKVDTANYFDNGSSIIVFRRLKGYESTEELLPNAAELIAEMKGEGFEKDITEKAKAVALNLDTAAIAYYSLSKVVL